MPSCCNPLEKLQSIQWDRYQSAALHGQIAAGILAAVAAVALVIIVSLNPTASYLAANYQTLITLGSVGGAALMTFAICTALHCCALRKIKTDIENKRRIEELRRTQSSEPSTVKVTATLDKDPIGYVKQVFVQSLVREFKDAVKFTVTADCIKTSKPIGDKAHQVELAFKEAESLFNIFLDNPYMYVSELLRYFGPGKKKPSVALRRLIAAFNSGDAAKLDEVRKEYVAVMRGNDFRDIAAALRSQSNEMLMRNFPKLLEDHFSLPDDLLKGLGRQILNFIFEKTHSNKKVLDALNTLKKNFNSEDLTKKVEGFIKLVLEEAQIPKEQYQQWNHTLVKYMLNTTFKKTVCGFLGMVARNIRILRLMFDKQMAKKPLFVSLDETFLLSESGDCIKKEGLQKEIFHLQSQFNFDRKEANRIALVALPASQDILNYRTLGTQHDVIKFCFDANPQANVEELKNITQSPAVVALGKKWGVRLVAIPISINDHDFKAFKNHETAIKAGAFLLKPLLPIWIKPRLLEILPKMEGNNLARFDALFKKLLELLIDPIYDGAIGDTPFRPPFERIITTKGEELAVQLETLILDENLTFEKIRDVWTKAIRGVAQEFEKIG